MIDEPVYTVLADIRAALGVGEKPMLTELPGIVRALVAELTCRSYEEADFVASVQQYADLNDQILADNDRFIAERDAALSALRAILDNHDKLTASDCADIARGALGGVACTK